MMLPARVLYESSPLLRFRVITCRCGRWFGDRVWLTFIHYYPTNGVKALQHFAVSDGKESACNTGDPGSLPESGRSPGGGGNGNPLQCSCLENSMDSPRGHVTNTLTFHMRWSFLVIHTEVPYVPVMVLVNSVSATSTYYWRNWTLRERSRTCP